MATVEIKGLQGTINKLNRLGKNIDTVVDNSLHKSAYDIKSEVEERIKIVGAVKTGRLRDSITVKKISKCRYVISTAVEYAPYVEFGTGSLGDPVVAHSMSNISKTGRRFVPHAPKPYLRPAFETKKSVVTMNLTRAIINAASGGAL